MIDTMYIYLPLTKDLYNHLYTKVKTLSLRKKVNLRPGKNNKTKIKRYCTHAFSNIGFLELAFLKANAKYPKYMFEIKLKPKKLIDQTNHYSVTYYYELATARHQFNNFIRTIDPSLPDFNDWHCRRIDYAINLKNQYTPIYIKLFKSGNIAKKFYDKVDNYSDLSGSLYLPSQSDELRINFYDKHDQLRNKDIINDITAVSNNLRMEVQCNRETLRYIKKKYSLADNTVKNLLSLKICQDIITCYYLMICDKQNYHSLNSATYHLNNISAKLKYSPNELISTLNIIKLYGSVWKSKLNFPLGKNAFEKRIREIKRTGINPVLLPNDFKISYLPNLHTALQQNFITTELGL